jgi:hypothetical protein
MKNPLSAKADLLVVSAATPADTAAKAIHLRRVLFVLAILIFSCSVSKSPLPACATFRD